MYLLILGQILNIEGWHLGMSTTAIVLSFIVAIWNINRVRKKDFNIIIDAKADVIYVKSEFKIRDERIKSVESLSIIQDKYLKDTLDEQHAILDIVQSDIKELLKRVK